MPLALNNFIGKSKANYLRVSKVYYKSTLTQLTDLNES